MKKGARLKKAQALIIGQEIESALRVSYFLILLRGRLGYRQVPGFV